MRTRALRRSRPALASARIEVVEGGAVTSAVPASFIVNDTHQITYDAKNVQNDIITPLSKAFVSSNAAVITVSATGLVTAIGAGTATVTGQLDGWTFVITYTVANPAATVASLTISPASATLVVGQGQIFTVNVYDGAAGTGNALLNRTVTASEVSGAGDVTLSAVTGTGPYVFTATATTLGSRVIKATCETVDSASPTITIQAPAGGNDYDPTRLGSDLIIGDTFASLSIGGDGGYASLVTYGGFYINANPQTAPPPVESSLQLVADPIFGQVVQCGQVVSGSHPELTALVPPKSYSPCISREYNFSAWGSTPGQSLWLRNTSRFLPNGNALFSATGSDVNGQNNNSSLSDTWKMWFLWQVGSGSRQEEVLLVADRHAISSGQVGAGGVNATVVRSKIKGTAPNFPIGLASEGLSGLSSLGEMLYNGVLAGRCSNQEWYEQIFGFICLTSTTFRTIHACRPISTGAGTVFTNASQYAWVMHSATTTVAIVAYNKYQMGGNKSDVNKRLFDQYHQWGPWEVSKASDPYGMLGWGV
jgi:hypothetical protein